MAADSGDSRERPAPNSTFEGLRAHNVFLFVPAVGQIITATTVLTTHALQQHLAAKSIQGGISTLSFPDIAELRSMSATIWYDTMPDSSHLLFIDADMGFPPD